MNTGAPEGLPLDFYYLAFKRIFDRFSDYKNISRRDLNHFSARTWSFSKQDTKRLIKTLEALDYPVRNGKRGVKIIRKKLNAPIGRRI